MICNTCFASFNGTSRFCSRECVILSRDDAKKNGSWTDRRDNW